MVGSSHWYSGRNRADRTERLKAYVDLVHQWAPRLDLVAPGDLERFEERHVADSLRVLPLLEELPEGACLDLGSGAGLPGVPLAIASGRHWRLLEPRRRRAAFLEEVVRTLDLDCEVLPWTAEDAARDAALQGAHAGATARAVVAPQAAFELLLPLVAPGGRAVLWVGKGADLPREAVEWAPGIATMTPS